MGAWLLWLGRDFWYFYDEWGFVTGRTLSLDGLLLPHNGHLSAFHSSLYVLLLRAFGADAYTVLRSIAIAVHLTVAFGAYLVVSRRKGRSWGMSALLIIGVLGTGWQNIFWPFQMSMMLPIAVAFLAVLVLQSRPDASWSVAGLVSLGLLASGGGIPVFLGVMLHSVVVRAWRRLAILAGIGVVYVAWWVAYGEAQGHGFHPRVIARYVGESSVLSTAAIGSRGARFGGMLLIAGLIALAFTFRGRWREAPTLVLLTAVVTGWIFTGFSRWEFWEPGASRYLYVGGAYVAVLLLLSLPLPIGPTGNVFALFVTVVLVLPNARLLRAESESFTSMTARMRAELTVIDAAGDLGRPGYFPDEDLAPQLDVGSYLSAREKYGDFGMSIDDAVASPAEYRVQMDRVAFEYLGVTVRPAFVESGDPQCSWTHLERGEALPLAGSTVVLDHRAHTSIGLRMFGDRPSPATIVKLRGSGMTAVSASRPGRLPPWQLNVNKAAVVGVCQGLAVEG